MVVKGHIATFPPPAPGGVAGGRAAADTAADAAAAATTAAAAAAASAAAGATAAALATADAQGAHGRGRAEARAILALGRRFAGWATNEDASGPAPPPAAVHSSLSTFIYTLHPTHHSAYATDTDITLPSLPPSIITITYFAHTTHSKHLRFDTDQHR